MLVSRFLSLILCLLISLVGTTQPILQRIRQAKPDQRVRLLMNYADTSLVVSKSQASALRLFDAVDEIGKQEQDNQLRRYCHFEKATYAKHTSINDSAQAALFLAVGQQMERDGDYRLAAICQHFAGRSYFAKGSYGQAFEHMLAANKTFQEIGYQQFPEIGRYLYELAFSYYHFHENKKLIQLLKTAIRYPVYNANLDIQNYNTIGLAYVRLSQIDDPAYFKDAEHAYLKAQQRATFYKDSLWIGIIASNLGHIYELKQDWPNALRSFRLSYTLEKQFAGNENHPNTTALRLANVFWHVKQLDSCRHYIDLSLGLYHRNSANKHLGRNLENESFMRRFYDVSRKYYHSIHQLEPAYVAADSMIAMYDRNQRRRNKDQISMIEQKLMIQQHQSEVKSIEAEKQNQRTIFWIVGVALLCIALLFFRLYYLARLRRRQESLISAEREKALQLEKRIVEDELERARADLAVFMDTQHQKNALIDTITAELKELHQTQTIGPDAQLIEEAQQNLINTTLLTKEDWAEFQRRFERVYPHFFTQLKNQFTDISPAEERLLALSKLHVNTRQMSRMLGISPESIRKTKYRLRKKIGADNHALLTELLSEHTE